MSERERLLPLTTSQREALQKATTQYERDISEEVEGWLVERGIDPVTRATFRLGSVGSLPKPGHDKHAGSLVIPYLDKEGQPLSMRFRCIQNHDHRQYGHGKYMSGYHDPGRMFNIRAIHESDDTIHVTEGELDAILLNRLGFPAVGLPGASSWRSHHARMLAGFSTIYLWGDPDDAGQDLVERISYSLRRARAVPLRDGDVTEVYQAGGREALAAALEEVA